MTMLVMGRSGSGELHAKLCDILKREGACASGRYKVFTCRPCEHA